MARHDIGMTSQLASVVDYDVERRKRFVGLGQDDLAHIAKLKDLVVDHVDEHAASFFDHLKGIEEAAELFKRPELLERARQLKRAHLIAMVGGVYDKAYVEQRVELGLVYSRAHIDARVFLGAFNNLMQSISSRVAHHFKDATTANQQLASLNKVAFLDIGVIVDILVAERERVIGLQQQAILEISTPALRIRDRLLILPIIGLLDSVRAKQLTDGLLRAIRENRAKVVVMDITGVVSIDSKVANHLIQTVAAARLMGAHVIVTGLSADVAQALVSLGINLGQINTVGDLQGGLELADRLLGYRSGQAEPADVQTLGRVPAQGPA